MTSINKAKLWTLDPFDQKTQQLVKQLIDLNPKEIEDSFYQNLEFGTGGIRGIMGVGTNRLNKYTLGKATQGLSNYLKEQFCDKILVVIAYDVRNNSKEFARLVADVFTANGIYVYLFENFRPTPELSFAVRYLKCQAGIVLTASHNPPEYNGYKVYFDDGAQVAPPHEENIIRKIHDLDFSDINFDGNEKLITIIGEEIDEQFMKMCLEFGSYKTDANSNLKVVFTSIHGTTIAIIRKILQKAGFNFFIVEEQSVPSGNFPTVKSPNPEDPESLKMAIEKAYQVNADLVVGTDPDGDRLGVAARNQKGKLELLNGNQTNTLLTNYLLNIWSEQGKISKNEFIGSTIVTSDIFLDLAKSHCVECQVGLTGFKWIGKMIHDSEEKKQFICGGEESCGFMVGTFVRDKDSITSTLLVCEIAAQAKKNGKTLIELLAEIYVNKTGFYLEDLISVTKNGKRGLEEIKFLMNNYRVNPPKEFAGSKVIRLDDYKASISNNLITGEKKEILIPQSDVLIFYTENGSKIACRPSGTEPKIKYYFSVKSILKSIEDYEKTKLQLKEKISELKKTFT